MKKIVKFLSAIFVGLFAFAFASCEKTPTEKTETPPVSETEEQGIDLSKYNLITIEQAIEIAKAAGTTATTERYYIHGTVKSIDNESYGQMTITNGTTDLMVYGTYGADGNDRYSALEEKPVAGDEVVLYATLCTYNGTPEVKSGWIVEFASKGKQDSSETEFPAAGSKITIAQALQIAKAAGETGTTDRWIIEGKVKTVVNGEYGEMYITDGTDEIYVYGTYDAEGVNRYSAMSDKPVAGDSIVLSVNLSTFKGTAQVKAGWIQSFTHEAPSIDLKDYTTKTIAQARDVEKGTKVKVTGVVAAITYANGKVPNGIYLVGDNSSIYVYGRDVAGQVKVGNTVTIAAAKDYYILADEIYSAEKYGYKGANQLSESYLLENDNKVSAVDLSWVEETTVKEIMETPVNGEENITTMIYKVNAYINKVPGNGFINYYINDLDNKTGNYVYTQCNGGDFAWLDEFDGKVCTVYLSPLNAKSTASGCIYRYVPISVEDNNFQFEADYAPEFVYTYNIQQQFLSFYHADPAIELIENVKYEEFGINATIAYTALTSNANIENSVLHLTAEGIAKIKVVVTAGNNTYETIIEIEFIEPEDYTAITVAQAIETEVGTTVVLEGIVAGSLVNKTGFYLIDETGIMAVTGAESVVSLLSVGDKIAIEGKRDLWGIDEENDKPGQICVTDIRVICNFYGNHAYDKTNFITGKTVDDISNIAYQEQHSNEVYVTKVIVKYEETKYYTRFSLFSTVEGSDKYLSLYCSSAKQYNWLKIFDGKEIEVELALCNWNKKTYYATCIISATIEGVTFNNTLNFAN